VGRDTALMGYITPKIETRQEHNVWVAKGQPSLHWCSQWVGKQNRKRVQIMWLFQDTCTCVSSLMAMRAFPVFFGKEGTNEDAVVPGFSLGF